MDIYIKLDKLEKLSNDQRRALNKYFKDVNVEIMDFDEYRFLPLVEKISSKFNIIDPLLVYSKCKKNDYVYVRSIIMVIKCKFEGMSHEDAAGIFNKDHSHCAQAAKRVALYCETDRIFRQKFKEILTELGYDYEKLNIKSI